MKILWFIFFLPAFAQAHCPNEVIAQGEHFCFSSEVSWLFGERKIPGNPPTFEATEIATPYLNPMGGIPQKEIYSKAQILVWKKGDKDHRGVEVPDSQFRIFPFMHMQSGHNHLTDSTFTFDSQTQQYYLQGVSLREMPGCWSLRWTQQIDIDDTQSTVNEILAASDEITEVSNYTNLSDEKNETMSQYCENTNDNGHPGGHDGGHNGHH